MSPFPENISKATESNWKRLNTDSRTKLTKRANKSQSSRRVVATTYLDSPEAFEILHRLENLPFSVEDILYSLCLELLRRKGLLDFPHVRTSMRRFSGREITLGISDCEWNGSDDLLGFVYQSLLAEGERNTCGRYYTGKEVVEQMVGDVVLTSSQTFYDPCCGSGAFLTGVKAVHPSCLYGSDSDPVAVMLASVNLLLKYPDCEFVPNVCQRDFLSESKSSSAFEEKWPAKFDCICTNPPWGTDKSGLYESLSIASREKSSMFLVKIAQSLVRNGQARLLMPSSILKVRIHSDVRTYLLTRTAIQSLELYSGRFAGVFTDYFSIRFVNRRVKTQQYQVHGSSGTFRISVPENLYVNADIPFAVLSGIEASVMEKMDACRYDDLSHSKWALGIVTGDNESKLLREPVPGAEAVFAGRQVEAFRMRKESFYVFFKPSDFQQCAKEECYRVPEKLIYRFIAKYPIVAYDNRQRLCLNSANIMVPEIKGTSVRSAAALLNSSLYRFYYQLKFKDIKVLKRNLQALPFPCLTKEQDEALGQMTDRIVTEGFSARLQSELDECVFSVFGIGDSERRYICQKNACCEVSEK